MVIKGKAFVYGDDINTDILFPGKYTYTVHSPEEMKEHALEDLDPLFCSLVREGDVIVGGKNFGCGSSREQAVSALKYAGIRAVIAVSFARIYFRNCINQGLPAVTLSHEAIEQIAYGDVVTLSLHEGKITLQRGKVFYFPALPQKVMEILDAGGLIPYTKKIIATV